MVKLNRVEESCHKHGLTMREVVWFPHCDADMVPTSSDSYLVCPACEDEDPLVIQLDLED